MWLLTLIVAIGAVGIGLGPAARLGALTGTLHVPWWALAGLFCAAEMTVTRTRGRSDSYPFSLSEIPLLLGLFFAAPVDLVTAQIAGATVALLLHRQSPLRVGFTVCSLTLQVLVAALAFHSVALAQDPTSTQALTAAGLAVLAFDGLNLLLIEAAVWLSSGSPDTGRLSYAAVLSLLGVLGNGSLAVLVLTLLWKEPTALWMVVAPTMILCFAYRAYMQERERHDRVEFLFESSRILQRSMDIDDNASALVEHARQMFRAEIAEMVLLPLAGEGPVLRSTIGPGDSAETAHMLREQLPNDLLSLVGEETLGVLVSPSSPEGGALLDAWAVKEAIAIGLRGETGLIGAIMIGNRRGTLTAFDEDDVTLLETFAQHLGAALENVRLERRLRNQAFHDSLTQLANRALFHDRVDHALARRGRGDKPMAILLLDLDDFKTVNDTLGHSAGDQLLVAVSERLRACLRPADTAARLGGDEFAVLLESTTPAESATVGQRVLDALRAPFHVAGEEVNVHSSIGIVTSRAEYTSVDKLLARADVAMYHAKSKGKGRYEMFEPSLQTAVVHRHALKAELQRAVTREEFQLHYQPIVDLATGGIYGAEALLRWDHPDRGLVPPLEFVGVAEETGLILPIGRLVLEQACQQSAMWRPRQGPFGPLMMSVNLSVRELQQPDITQAVTHILRRTGVDASTIILEITESILVDDLEQVVGRLEELKRLGVRLAIDDFGTGYSSLSALRNLPIDMLKIAKPFIDGLGVDAEQEAFAHAILKLGSTLNLTMVAEGIETVRQAERLRVLGCDLGQGFHFAEPLTAEEFETMLDRNGVVPRPGVLLSVVPGQLPEKLHTA